MGLHVVKPLVRGLTESVFLKYEVVRRESDDRCFGVPGMDVVCGPADAGGGVAACRFEQYVLHRNFGELFCNEVFVSLVCHQDYILVGHQGQHPFHSHL